MADYGIKISKEDANVLTAEETDILLNITDPLAKLDVTNDVSFQNIELTFDTDPTEPSFPTTENIDTLVYSFPHGYTYTPQQWMLVQVIIPVATPFYQEFFLDNGIVATSTVFSGATFWCAADETDINFYITKSITDAAGAPTPINGLRLLVRSYVFVQDPQTT